ncbi:MAG: hypothetical protein IJL20_10635 [Lachnospiraceae bacterium]|nr:hypothetical protein [Lachnospiraceae bacterium]
MDIISEKALYKDALLYEFSFSPDDCVLWGEDLYNAAIIVFPKKIRDVPWYDGELKRRLVTASLVYHDLNDYNALRLMNVRWDPVDKFVYISEPDFPLFWRRMKNSIRTGLLLNKNENESVRKAEEIVDLSLLKKTGCTAVLKHGKIAYEQRILTDAEKKIIGKKQSALDNPKNRYFWSDLDSFYHDKECPIIKSLPPEHFCASGTRPVDMNMCGVCLRQMCFWEACTPRLKQMPFVSAILSKDRLSDKKLVKYVFDNKLVFSAETREELTVKCGEDTWIIKGFDEEKLSLWHNNYVKTASRERYITSGFHEQKIEKHSLLFILDYISGYTFDKHLAAEDKMGGLKQVDMDKMEGMEIAQKESVNNKTSKNKDKIAWKKKSIPELGTEKNKEKQGLFKWFIKCIKRMLIKE